MRRLLAGIVLLLLFAGCANGSAGQGSVGALAVDPANSRVVYALTDFALLKSVDGGGSWRIMTFPDANLDAFAFAASGRLYVTGVTSRYVAFRSIDSGRHWQELRAPFNTDVNALAVAPSNHTVWYAGMSGPGPGVFRSTNGGATWRTDGLRNQTIDTLTIDPQNPRVVYAVQRGNPFQSRVFKTTNGGSSWQAIGTATLAGESVQAITVDPRHSRVLYAAAMDGVFESTDGGAHWRLDGVPGQEIFVNQVIVNPRSPSRIYAAVLDDGVYKSSDAGRTWRRLGLPGENVDVLAISADGHALYAGTDNDGVFALPVRRR